MTRARQMESARREIESRSVWETCRDLLKPTPEEILQREADHAIWLHRHHANMDAAIARHRAKEVGQ